MSFDALRRLPLLGERRRDVGTSGRGKRVRGGDFPPPELSSQTFARRVPGGGIQVEASSDVGGCWAFRPAETSELDFPRFPPPRTLPASLCEESLGGGNSPPSNSPIVSAC